MSASTSKEVGTSISNIEEEEEEELWIEAEGLGGEADVQQDDEPDVGDLFADPDPYDDFEFTFLDNISITLRGIKAENGQTLNSTGLTLWRASRLLCDYMVSEKGYIKDKTVLELGAGLGLCGTLAHFLGAKRVVLTDGDTDTLAAMRANVASNSAQVECCQLFWGRNLEAFAKKHACFDVILASDVIYVPQVVDPLFDTVMQLMSVGAQFWLAYARRNVSIDLVLESAQRNGLQWSEPKTAEGVFVFEKEKELVCE